jgi:hypothetical protein
MTGRQEFRVYGALRASRRDLNKPLTAEDRKPVHRFRHSLAARLKAMMSRKASQTSSVAASSLSRKSRPAHRAAR